MSMSSAVAAPRPPPATTTTIAVRRNFDMVPKRPSSSACSTQISRVLNPGAPSAVLDRPFSAATPRCTTTMTTSAHVPAQPPLPPPPLPSALQSSFRSEAAESDESFHLSGSLSNNNNKNASSASLENDTAASRHLLFAVATPSSNSVNSRPSSGGWNGSQPQPPKRTVIASSTSLPTRADNLRRFHALESVSRGSLLAEEDECRSILAQQLRGTLYKAVERESIKRRVPSAAVINAASTAVTASSPSSFPAEPHRHQRADNEAPPTSLVSCASSDPDDVLLSQILAGVVPYRSYTARAGMLVSSRDRKALTSSSPSASGGETREAVFERNLRRHQQQHNNYHHTSAATSGGAAAASAFEIDSPEKPPPLSHPIHDDSSRRLTPRSQARYLLEAHEQMERAVFLARIFLPELLRCVEDAESIERRCNEERRAHELQSGLRPKYSEASKPLVHEWRRRELAAVTIQYAQRKVSRGLQGRGPGLGWHRTHKELGLEIEHMRKEKHQQRLKQQAAASSASSSSSSSAAPVKKRYSSQASEQRIAELNRQAELEMQQRREQQLIDLEEAETRARTDNVVFEARWCLQRQLQNMSSTFFDNVTKPAMARIVREEDAARSEFVARDVVPLLEETLLPAFTAQRAAIQRKNDCEALEGRQRAAAHAEEKTDFDRGIVVARAEHLASTRRKIQQRHAAEWSAVEASESAARRTVADAMVEDVSAAYMWHCSIVDDSLQVLEEGQRRMLRRSFITRHNAIFAEQAMELVGGTLARQMLAAYEATVMAPARLKGAEIVQEPLIRRTVIERAEEDSASILYGRLHEQAAAIKKQALRRVAAVRTIQVKFWRSFKSGDLGRSGRKKYFADKFAGKRAAAARKRTQALVAQTQQDLERALRDANIHIVAGFSQKLKLLQKQEVRARADFEAEDLLMRKIFDANMVSAIAATCVNETTVLSRFEAYHRFQNEVEQREWNSRCLTFMQLVFVKDVKIRPAQRAVRCYLARQVRRRLIAAALSTLQQRQEPLARVQLEMACHEGLASDIFMGRIMPALHRASFAAATFVWLVEQERAARECLVMERNESARGYTGWQASLGKDAIAEEQQTEFRGGLLGAWHQQIFFLDLFEMEISQRGTVVTMQSELATGSLLLHVESLQRMMTASAVEAQSYKMAFAAIELNEFTARTVLQRDAIAVGFALLIHRQETAQRSLLQKSIMLQADLNVNIYQREGEARDAIREQWAKRYLAVFGQLEQDMRFTMMQREHEARGQLRLLAFEDDWRIDVSVTRRYELLMLLELAESSRRKVFLVPEMRALEAIVDFDRDCRGKKALLFASDYCHGMRAILEAQQAEQRAFVAADQTDNSRHLFLQVDIAAQLDLQHGELKARAAMQHIQQAKRDHLLRSHVRLARNANYRAADVVWRNCATRALLGNGIAPAASLAAAPTASSSSSSFVSSAIALSKQQQQQQQQQQNGKEGNELRHDVKSDFFKITHELLYTFRTQIMHTWLRVRATELALLQHESEWNACLQQITKEVASATNMMHAMLARDPYHQTMKLVYGLRCRRDEVWAEQSVEFATKILSSDAFLLPSYVAIFHNEVRGGVLDRLLQRRERGAIELQEDEGMYAIRTAEKHLRRVLLLLEAERAERAGFCTEERVDFEEWVVEFQDTILKPLEALRNERELRSAIVLEEAGLWSSEVEAPFAEQLPLCWGPQRAWTLLRHRDALKKAEADRSSFLRQEERRRRVKASLDSASTPQQRQDMAVQMLQRWARRRLWTSVKAAENDRAVAAALAESDALQHEVFCAVDVRDRYEKLRYCAVQLQKVFRGHRVRRPALGQRCAAMREALVARRQLEATRLQQERARTEGVVKREEEARRIARVSEEEQARATVDEAAESSLERARTVETARVATAAAAAKKKVEEQVALATAVAKKKAEEEAAAAAAKSRAEEEAATAAVVVVAPGPADVRTSKEDPDLEFGDDDDEL